MKAALGRRGAADRVDELLDLDARRRALLTEVEERRGAKKKASERIAQAKRAGEEAPDAIAESNAIGRELGSLEQDLADAERRIDELLITLPNLPDPSAPDGFTEEDAALVRVVGDPPAFGFEPRDHLDIGTSLGLIDMEAAARASGSRFAYLKGDLAFLELALVQYALRKLAGKGFQPVIPPVLVREEPMFGTGFLPTDRAQIYEVPSDDLFLVGTSEVSIAALHADQIMAADDLPLRYAGFSTCFRREAGAAGRDTRGIFRVHQFDKVEMFSFVDPATSGDEHERLLAIEEEILQELEIPYRVVNVAAGDLGASAAKKYDCEAWIPGQGRYRELTSCSNTTDYQARRLRARFRAEPKGSPRPVHTLNGTAVAVGRTILAIMENHQTADGGFDVPAVLHPFGGPAVVPGPA